PLAPGARPVDGRGDCACDAGDGWPPPLSPPVRLTPNTWLSRARTIAIAMPPPVSGTAMPRPPPPDDGWPRMSSMSSLRPPGVHLMRDSPVESQHATQEGRG